MALFDDKVKKQLGDILAQMKDEVGLVFFSQEIECLTCRDAGSFVQEVASLNPKMKMQKFNFVTDREKAQLYGVDKVPAIVVLDKNGKNTGIKFYGIPGGYEINSFLGGILETSGKREPLPKEVADRIAAVKKDVHIQVFVTLACPYCPTAVATAHRLALENDHIRADMVESNTFTPQAIRYNVNSVPKIIINEKHEMIGAQPITAFLDVIEKL